MIKDLEAVKSLIRVKRIHSDGFIFRLHYAITPLMLFVFAILISTKAFFQDTVACYGSDYLKEQNRVYDTFCWMNTTYHESREMRSSLAAKLGFLPAEVYPYMGGSQNTEHHRYLTYYQWVGFFFILSGVGFYLPHWMWKAIDSKRLETLCYDLGVGIGPEQVLAARRKDLADYLWRSRGMHTLYALKYFMCEILALLMLLTQFIAYDVFLEGYFTPYGLKWIEFLSISFTDGIYGTTTHPGRDAFPIKAKCIFHTGGMGGDLQRKPLTCLLPLNILNDKFFLVLWFWFVALMILTVALIIFRLVLMCSASMRARLFDSKYEFLNSTYTNLVLSRRLSFGDWYILYMIGSNLDGVVFKETLDLLAQEYADFSALSSVTTLCGGTGDCNFGMDNKMGMGMTRSVNINSSTPTGPPAPAYAPPKGGPGKGGKKGNSSGISSMSLQAADELKKKLEKGIVTGGPSSGTSDSPSTPPAHSTANFSAPCVTSQAHL